MGVARPEGHVGKEFYDRLQVTEEEKKALITRRGLFDEPIYETLYAAEIPAPSASNGFEENVATVGYWLEKFGVRVSEFTSGLAAGEAAVIHWPAVVSSAKERYRSRFLELAAKVPEFMIWAMLNEGAATRSAIAELRADMAVALDANRAALGRLTELLALDAGQLRVPARDIRRVPGG